MDDQLRALVRRLAETPDDAALALAVDNELDRIGKFRGDRPELKNFEVWKGSNRCNVRPSCTKIAAGYVKVLTFYVKRSGVPNPMGKGMTEVASAFPRRLEYPACLDHQQELAKACRPEGREDQPGEFPGYGIVHTLIVTPLEKRDDPRASNVNHRPRAL